MAANTLRDFLAETFNRLQRSAKDLDSASGELNAIAGLMASGTNEQFNRTDQVATAMNEMSATARKWLVTQPMPHALPMMPTNPRSRAKKSCGAPFTPSPKCVARSPTQPR